ncbi:MAG: hypothetical protein JNJ94_06350 [Chlorobi bacterium]|nr:hypothetical protein [Chlorobiota bacterium]
MRNFNSISATRTNGHGEPNRIALLLSGHDNGNGMGDDIHALPAIAQRAQLGCSIDVFTRKFRLPLFNHPAWSNIGVRAFAGEELGVGSTPMLQGRYGAIYSLTQWCLIHDAATGGNVVVDRFDQFASLIDTFAPQRFSFPSYIAAPDMTANTSSGVVVALTASGFKRSIPTREGRNLIRGIIREELPKERMLNLGLPQHGGELLPTWGAIVNAVASARVVVSVDTGVLALALALNRPTIAIFGPTTPRIVVQQFARYTDGFSPTVLQPNRHKVSDRSGCQFPCNFQSARGYGEGNTCKHRGYGSECLRRITTDTDFLATFRSELHRQYQRG